MLADHSGLPVVFDTEFTNDFRETLILRHFGLNRWVNPPTLVEEITSSLVLQALEQMGWHVLEQRFPRRAYVVIRDPSEPVVLAPLDGTEAIYQCPTCKGTVAWIYGSSIRKGIPTGRKVVVHTCPICKADWLAGIPPSNECAACHVMDKKCPTCAAHVGGP